MREPCGLGRGECGRDADGVSPAQGASQADEVDQHAGAIQRGDSPGHQGGKSQPREIAEDY